MSIHRITSLNGQRLTVETSIGHGPVLCIEGRDHRGNRVNFVLDQKAAQELLDALKAEVKS